MSDQNIIIVDSDAFIAFIDSHDIHASHVETILHDIYKHHMTLLYPSTVIAETITTIQRKLHKLSLISPIIKLIHTYSLPIIPIDESIITHASTFFNPEGSKHNTFFDAIVAATAKKYHAKAIFSFDEWYTKQGFTLAKDL